MEGCYANYIQEQSDYAPFPRDFCGYMWLWNNNQAALTPYATLDYFAYSSSPPLTQRLFKDVLSDQPYPNGANGNYPAGTGFYTGNTLYQNLATAYEHWLVRLFPCALPAYTAHSISMLLSTKGPLTVALLTPCSGTSVRQRRGNS